MDDWQYFHHYRRLAEQGTVKPLTCPDHPDTVLITRIGPEDSVALWCVQDDAFTYPGLDVIHQVRAVVNEHWIEDE